MSDYESIIELIARLERSSSPAERDIVWTTEARVVGVSRTHDDRLEIFLRGSQLVPTSQIIQEALEFQTWHRRGNAPGLDANRLLLPPIGHFDQVAGFVCTELLRRGADSSLMDAFRETEPIIELAIQRLRISDEAFLGLAGELLFLHTMCRRVDGARLAEVVAGWSGWQPSRRDFVWNSLGVEVKTTARSTSSHQVSGTHQVEPYDGEHNGMAEQSFFLLSIGLQPALSHENTFTVPLLVEGIAHLLRSAGRYDLVEVFLSHVREYGSASGLGYDHVTMAGDNRYNRRLLVAFARAYDMTDNRVEVLRRANVVPHRHVDPGSVAYRVELPVTISGDVNPILGINQTAEALLRVAGLGTD